MSKYTAVRRLINVINYQYTTICKLQLSKRQVGARGLDDQMPATLTDNTNNAQL